MISVIIPNRNSETTIGSCLEAVFASAHNSFEVIVVDDCSEDNSVALIRQFPCRLIQLSTPHGAAGARNIGAGHAQGEILFFTDADCVILQETLSQVETSCRESGKSMIIGGTYTRKPYDQGFYSVFQSVFVHHSETKSLTNPDYIATHAMAVYAETFGASPGFPEDLSLPIIEDVAFSHSMRHQGFSLMMNPQLQVRHIFHFSFWRSIKNAFRKSKYWTVYSLNTKDIFKDSGCASHELKINVLSLFVSLVLMLLCFFSPQFFAPLLLLTLLYNLTVSRRLFSLFYKTGGLKLFLCAAFYYTTFYALAVGCGGMAGLFHYLFACCRKRTLSGQPRVRSGANHS